MKKSFWIFVLLLMVVTPHIFNRVFSQASGSGIAVEDIVNRVDNNRFSESRKSKMRMIVHGERESREMSLNVYAVGSIKSFAEFLSPKREKGTKMLKLQDRLWVYSPTTDRTIQLSGHLLRQSMMGSDISYEDMMDDRRLIDIYNGTLVGEEEFEMEQAGKTLTRKVYVVELTAKVENVSYARRKLWVDKEYFLPLKEELYAKRGSLLKRLISGDVHKVDGRWVAEKVIYKDMLKSGQGTEILTDDLKFNPKIPKRVFTKAILRK